MFLPNNMLLKYMNAQPRDMYDIAGALMGYINADPYFQTNDFDDAVNYVLSNGVNENELFMPFDSRINLIHDESKWDEDYFSYARVYLKDNFCRERIAHVKQIAHKLHPEQKQSTEFPMSEAAPQIGGQQLDGKKNINQQTYLGYVVAGVIIAFVLLVMLIVVII